ncbi:heme ABC transporter permease CcmC [Neisseriaceae bacterium B1]
MQKLRRFSSPKLFDELVQKIIKPLFVIAIILSICAFILGFIVAPTDAVQGHHYRIMYVHVPSSWLAMIIYLAMAFWSFVYLIWRTHLSALLTQALAPTGMLMSILSLLTGSFWGKPTWGTFWVWDARLTSMLLLFFLYAGYIALVNSIENDKRAAAAGSLIAIVGAINVPIIYFSVIWWNTLHQGASISFQSGVSMHQTMFIALLCATFAMWSYAIAMVLWRTRYLLRDKNLLKME